MLAPLVFMAFENQGPINLITEEAPTKIQKLQAKLSALTNKL